MSSPKKGQSLRLAVSRTMEKNRVFHMAQCLIRSIEEETLAGVDLLHTLEVVRRTSNPDLDYFKDLNKCTNRTSAADVGVEKSTEDAPTNDCYQAVSSGKNNSLQIDRMPQINETMDEDLLERSESKNNDREILKTARHEILAMPLRRSKSLPSFMEFTNHDSFDENNRCMSELRTYELSRLHHVPKHTNETVGNEKSLMLHGIVPNLECKKDMSSDDLCKQQDSQDAISICSDQLEVKSLDDDTQSDNGSFLREFYPSKVCSSMVREKTLFDKDNFVANYVINLPLKSRKNSIVVDLTKQFNEPVSNVDETGFSLVHIYADGSLSDTLHSSRQHKKTVIDRKTLDNRSAKHVQNMREVARKNEPSSKKETFQRKSKHLIDYSTFVRSYQLYKQRRDERLNTYSKPEMIRWGDAFVQNMFHSEPTSYQKSPNMDYEEKKKAWNGIMCENLTARDKTDRHLSNKCHESAISSSHRENKFRLNDIPKLPSTGYTKRHLPDIYPTSGISKGRSSKPLGLKPHRSRDATYVDYRKLDTKSLSSRKPGKITETRHAKEK
ncbi:hypothetical protein CHS0354_007368 [Potamilus streckersoni]|uniref:Uncharacterized protein n=1 Tax=Potamilus streckersoni TaxID=2493646 RepID=A0AAE0TIS9_9BIVA|nr:hypothetical protein CHS0354_007368 [Potamilus streckersoni]